MENQDSGSIRTSHTPDSTERAVLGLPNLQQQQTGSSDTIGLSNMRSLQNSHSNRGTAENSTSLYLNNQAILANNGANTINTNVNLLQQHIVAGGGLATPSRQPLVAVPYNSNPYLSDLQLRMNPSNRSVGFLLPSVPTVAPPLSAGNVNLLPVQPQVQAGIAMAPPPGQALMVVPKSSISPNAIQAPITSNPIIGVVPPSIPAVVATASGSGNGEASLTNVPTAASMSHLRGGQFEQQVTLQQSLNQIALQRAAFQQVSTAALPVAVAASQAVQPSSSTNLFYVPVTTSTLSISSLAQQQLEIQNESLQQAKQLMPLSTLSPGCAALQDTASRQRVVSSQQAKMRSNICPVDSQRSLATGLFPDGVTSNNPHQIIGDSNENQTKDVLGAKRKADTNDHQCNKARRRSFTTANKQKEEDTTAKGGRKKEGHKIAPPNRRRNTQDGAWAEMFQRLVQYKETHGHCNVPARYKHDKKLGSWVHNQRIRNESRYSDERVRKLESIGFVWTVKADMNEEAWQSKYERLAEYKRIHGHCFVPQRHKDDESLGNWVHNQRIRKNKMCPTRREKLDKLGFFWRCSSTKKVEEDEEDEEEEETEGET